MRGSFGTKNSIITHIHFELQPILIFSPVANFGDQSLNESNILSISTYQFLTSKTMEVRAVPIITVMITTNTSKTGVLTVV